MSQFAHPGFRLFILGAGFSVPAGLPLADQLYREVIEIIEQQVGKDSAFHSDRRNYLEYIKKTKGSKIPVENMTLEEIMTYLDIEHFLGLRGSDTWSEEGNKGQLVIKKAIGKVIQIHTPAIDILPECYYKFADSLSVNDYVLTFNYDVVLERALEYIGKPYRLYPTRSIENMHSGLSIDSSRKEVVVIKLHGSVDWFSDKEYQSIHKGWREQGFDGKDSKIHAIFDSPEYYDSVKLVECQIDELDPLSNLYRIKNVDLYYKRQIFPSEAPFILSPSNVKFVYSDVLQEFWFNLNRTGGWNLGVNVIGFSLPEHDEYIRQILFNIITNYQNYYWDSPFIDGVLKENVKFVDFKNNSTEKTEYKNTYRLSNRRKSQFWFNGFSSEAVDFLFNCPRNNKRVNDTQDTTVL